MQCRTKQVHSVCHRDGDGNHDQAIIDPAHEVRGDPTNGESEQQASEDEPEHLSGNPHGRGVQERGSA